MSHRINTIRILSTSCVKLRIVSCNVCDINLTFVYRQISGILAEVTQLNFDSVDAIPNSGQFNESAYIHMELFV